MEWLEEGKEVVERGCLNQRAEGSNEKMEEVMDGLVVGELRIQGGEMKGGVERRGRGEGGIWGGWVGGRGWGGEG